MPINWAITAPIIAGAVTSGASMLQSAIVDMDYRVRVEIEIENWTRWELADPEAKNNAGYISIPPSTVYPLKKEIMVARKTGDTATGSYGTVAWHIRELDRMIVIMWSAPYSFDFHSNWMGIGITKQGVRNSSREWFDKMYKEEYIQELETYKIKKYNNSASTLKIITDYIEIAGNMGNSHHTTLKIKVKPIHGTDLPSSIS